MKKNDFRDVLTIALTLARRKWRSGPLRSQMAGHGRNEPAAEELAAIRARATLMLRKCQERAHVERALLAAIDQHELVQT